MPHYLVHGADKNTAEDRLHAVFCASEEQAAGSAANEGLFVSSIEALDAGAPSKPNDGTSGGWLRMATILSKQQRFDEAVDLLYQVYNLIDREGVQHGIGTYVKLPNYLVRAGRRDDAWRFYNMLKLGRVEGTRGIQLMPANLGEIHRRMSKLCKGETAEMHNLIGMVCELVGEVFVGRCEPSAGESKIREMLADTSLQIDDPTRRASEIGKHLAKLDGKWGKDYAAKGLKAAYAAEAIVGDAIVSN